MEVLLKIFIHFVINAKLTAISRGFTYIFFQKIRLYENRPSKKRTRKGRFALICNIDKNRIIQP